MKDRKLIGYWLLFGAFLVICMVILGGYTRLSHSGLSMVTWKPITGVIPPLNASEWEAEFERYKGSPEYIKRNYNFTIEEFKKIYWPEFFHRLLGRLVGLVFLLPFLFFLVTKKIKERRLITDLIVIFLLGGLQGLVGWYMVKSGLVEDPNVSHYRLAIHLSLALILYSFILWVYLKNNHGENRGGGDSKMLLSTMRMLLAFTVVQIIYGAFVAGLKAGLYYPTWPMMGSHLLPPEAGVAVAQEGISSFFETASLVQFMHRWIAAFIFGISIWLYYKSRKLTLFDIHKKIIAAVLMLVGIQFTLGVLTLLYHVPLALALLHQIVGVAFLSTIILGLFFFREKPVIAQGAS